MPPDFRQTAIAEVLLKELETQSVLIDDRTVMSRRLVVHAPTKFGKGKWEIDLHDALPLTEAPLDGDR